MSKLEIVRNYDSSTPQLQVIQQLQEIEQSLNELPMHDLSNLSKQLQEILRIQRSSISELMNTVRQDLAWELNSDLQATRKSLSQLQRLPKQLESTLGKKGTLAKRLAELRRASQELTESAENVRVVGLRHLIAVGLISAMISSALSVVVIVTYLQLM
jgi:chaperonin cofactor prefoldin